MWIIGFSLQTHIESWIAGSGFHHFVGEMTDSTHLCFSILLNNKFFIVYAYSTHRGLNSYVEWSLYFCFYCISRLFDHWLEGSNNLKWWLYFEMLGPKFATYQLLCVTLNVIVVALSPGSYRAVNHEMGTQTVAVESDGLGSYCTCILCLCVHTNLQRWSVLYVIRAFKPEVVTSSSRCSYLP